MKSCPFCNSTDIGVKDNILEEKTWAYCRKCFATGPRVSIHGPTKFSSDIEIMELAYKAWDRRNS